MRLKELAARLEQEGVPSAVYCLSRATTGDQFCVHEEEDGSWSVYYSERGARLEPKRFEDEEMACDCLYDQIKRYYP